MVALDEGEVKIGPGIVIGVPVWVNCGKEVMSAAATLVKLCAGQGYDADMAAGIVFAPAPPVIQAEE